MEENINIIKSVGIDEREKIIVDFNFARWLETGLQGSVGLRRREVRNNFRHHGRSNAGQCPRTCSRST